MEMWTLNFVPLANVGGIITLEDHACTKWYCGILTLGLLYGAKQFNQIFICGQSYYLSAVKSNADGICTKVGWNPDKVPENGEFNLDFRFGHTSQVLLNLQTLCDRWSQPTPIKSKVETPQYCSNTTQSFGGVGCDTILC